MSDKTNIFFILCIGLAIITFAVLQIYRGYPTKTSFVVGQCYEIANQDNPFREQYFIKVVDIKNGYIQYFYSSSPSILSSYKITDVDMIFKPVKCGELKED